MSPSRISNVNSGRMKEVTAFSLAQPEALSITRQDVIGQREQRVALGAWRKRVEWPLGDLGELRRAPVRGVARSGMFEDSRQVGPRPGVHRGVADDCADDAPDRCVALLLQMN